MRCKSRKAAALFCLLALALPCLASGGMEAQAAPQFIGLRQSSISAVLNNINTLYQYLKANAFYELDDSLVEDNLTRALMAALDDPYASYVSTSEEVDEEISGTYVGIGIYLTKMDPLFIDWDDPGSWMIHVESPFPGGPADLAGIKARDMISHIDGQIVADMDADEASKLLRGQEGVEMTLTIHRGDSVFNVTLTPEVVVTPSVDSAMIPGTSIGYMAIDDFTESTLSLVSEALSQLSYQGMEALVIDLRNNPGGLVSAAHQVSDFFLQEGTPVVKVEFKEGSSHQDFSLQAGNLTRKYTLPVAILVNGGTASASEIFSAALQDNGRAMVIGSQTFGKGIIQDVVPWNDGYIQYTSAHYLTPEGNDIHEVGITPDVVIEEEGLDEEEAASYFAFASAHQEDLLSWIDEHPDYNVDNIEAFAKTWEDEVSFDPLYLRILIRNEYITAMPAEERPVMDPVYDTALREAVSLLEGK